MAMSHRSEAGDTCGGRPLDVAGSLMYRSWLCMGLVAVSVSCRYAQRSLAAAMKKRVLYSTQKSESTIEPTRRSKRVPLERAMPATQLPGGAST